MTTDPTQLSETVARHDEQIVGLVRAVDAIGRTVKESDAKLDTISAKVSASVGSSGKMSMPTLVGVGGLLIAASALLWPMIEDIRGDAQSGIAKLDAAHTIEVARIDAIEFRQGQNEMFQGLFIAGKLKLEAP